MGKQTRKRPERLPEKLLEIRLKLGLSQNVGLLILVAISPSDA